MDNGQRNKELIKGTGTYAIGTFGTKILSFLIVPLYTYYISTEDMGVYDLLMSTINLLTPIITMQISDAAYRWILQDMDNKELYIRSTIQVLCINCILAGFLIMIGNHFFSIPYCGYFCVVLILSRILATIQKLLRALKNQRLFAISGLSYSVIFLGLNFFQICILKQGVRSLFQSAIIADICAILLIVFVEPRLHVNYIVKPNINIIKDFFKFSVPLVPNYLNWWVINSSDRYIVAFFLGTSANGILAIAHKFPTVLQTVLNLFTTSWQDITVAEAKDNTGSYYTGIFRKFSLFALSMLWILIPFTKMVVLLVMSPAYKIACNFIAFYYLGTVFQSFASFYGVGYLRNKNTGKAFSTSIYGAIVNAVINFGCIRMIGLQAAAISTFIGFLVMWLIRERQNRKELGIQVKWNELIAFTVITICVAIVSNMTNIKVNIGLSIIGILTFMVINKNNIMNIVRIIKNKIQRRFAMKRQA